MTFRSDAYAAPVDLLPVRLRSYWSLALLPVIAVSFSPVGPGNQMKLPLWMIGFSAVACVAVCFYLTWSGVTVTPRGLQTHSLNSRFIPWPAVREISMGHGGFRRGTRVRITTVNGERILLAAPNGTAVNAGPQSTFGRQLALIDRTWIANRGW